MKNLLLIFTFTIAFIPSFAGQIIAVSNNGDWNTNATWNLGRQPADGDIVVIPSGMTVVIGSNVNDGAATLIIDVFGTLNFTGSHRILLGNASVIYVYGNITKVGGVNDFIKIGAIQVWDQTDGAVIGPKYATSALGSFGPFVPLPIKFTSFNVVYTNHSVFIKWSTSEELNAKDFTVEKSLDGKNWNDLGKVKAAGNTNYNSDYSLTDNNINSFVIYYRIKETDITGELTYTSIKSIKTDDQSQVSISISSLGNSKVLVQFSSEVKGVVSIQYISLEGQVVKKQELNNPMGQQILTNNSLHGNFFVSITTEQGVHIARQVIL